MLRSLAVLGCLSLTAQVAAAQVSGFDLERLDLNPGATASFVSGTGDVMGKGAWRASLIVHYQQDPLVLSLVDTNERLGAIVGQKLTTHLVGAWAPLDWLELGLQVPIVVYQGGDDLRALGIPAVASPAMGTPWITGRFAFLRESLGAPIDLALQLGLGLPFGSSAAFTNATPLAFAPRVGLGRSVLSWLRLGGDLGFMLRGAPPDLANTGSASAFTFALSATTRGAGLRGELTFRTAIALDAPGVGSELLLGARYPLGKWIELFVLGGPGLGTLRGTPAFRVLGGVTVQPPALQKVVPTQRCDESVSETELQVNCATQDADRDGFMNDVDACPRVAGVAATKGCPLPDGDGDGLHDEIDQCPKEAGAHERKGCPLKDQDGDGIEDADDACVAEVGTPERKGCPLKDQDGDGIEDANDACVTEVGTAEREGCPVRDADQDSVEDDADECPAEAGPVERKGCPLTDQDGDTVEDALDNCPTVKGALENAGCPAKQKQLVVITKDKLVIQEKVYFATGKAQVLARSSALLDNVAQVLLAHPEHALVRIEGHTDSQGVAAKNLALSQARADAVKKELIKRKVSAERLEAVGFGQEKPFTTNDTPAGREQNRRVEFTFESALKP